MADSDKLVLEGELELWTQESGFAAHEVAVGGQDIGDVLADLFGIATKDEPFAHGLSREGVVGRVRIAVEVLERYDD